MSICALILSCGVKKQADNPADLNHGYDDSDDRQNSANNPLVEFTFPEPSEDELSRELYLWATYYYTPTYDYSTDKKHSLLDLKGRRLGPTLPSKQWCMAALEGSVNIRNSKQENIVYNFAGYGSFMQVNCSPYFSYYKSGKVRFKRARGPYGDGAGKKAYILFPYRTIAVDTSKISLGTVIYIPRARGIRINLSNNITFIHDGYFFAADRGGAIKGNQIDVFMGFEFNYAFKDFVKSSRNKLFKAYVVENIKINKLLEDAHLTKSTPLQGDEF